MLIIIYWKYQGIKVTSNKIPDSFDGFKILQLSDLHSKSFGDGNIKLMEKINGENPDIVVMTGDMVDSKILILMCLLIWPGR